METTLSSTDSTMYNTIQHIPHSQAHQYQTDNSRFPSTPHFPLFNHPPHNRQYTDRHSNPQHSGSEKAIGETMRHIKHIQRYDNKKNKIKQFHHLSSSVNPRHVPLYEADALFPIYYRPQIQTS